MWRRLASAMSIMYDLRALARYTSRTLLTIASTSSEETTGCSSRSWSAAPWPSRISISAVRPGYPSEMRSRKRSSWLSGSRYVPSCSTGFCVAMTMNGGGSTCVTPSTLIWRSSIASSSADCVLGEARLISSASTMLANSGPGWKRKRSLDRS